VRLAIFGGSFDPPHIGHLLVAVDAAEQLAFDRVVFVPAATQPLKAGRAGASAAHRVEMARLLVQGDPRLEVSTVEVDRAGLSFTVDTVAHFAERQPTDERFLLLGDDVLATFAQWREPARILELAQVVLLERDGRQSPLPAVMQAAGTEVVRLRPRRVDVSSTEIRERVRSGKSVRGMVTDGVAEFIARAGLYR
jgi:nicotinate-nucleotide adenylyltransferase